MKDDNALAVDELRKAGHPVAVLSLPQDPAVAFALLLEGLFCTASIVGAYENKDLLSTPKVPANDEALARFRNGNTEMEPPAHSFEGMGVEDKGVFDSGRIQTGQVDELLSQAGISHPNGADRYAACLYLLHKKTAMNGSDIAEIRYLGTPSQTVQAAMKKGQRILSLLLRKVVRLGFRMNVDYMGSLAEALQGSPVLMETLLWPAKKGVPSWTDTEPSDSKVRRLLSGDTLRLHQRAIVETFRAGQIPHVILSLPVEDEAGSETLQRFFKQAEKRFKQFQASESDASPGETIHGGEKSNIFTPAEKNSPSTLGRILLALGDFAEQMLASIGRRFHLPNLYPRVIPPGPIGAMPSSAGPGTSCFHPRDKHSWFDATGGKERIRCEDILGPIENPKVDWEEKPKPFSTGPLPSKKRRCLPLKERRMNCWTLWASIAARWRWFHCLPKDWPIPV